MPNIQSMIFEIIGKSDSVDKMFDGMGGKAKAAAAAASAAFAGLVISNSFDISEGRAKMQAQLGLTAGDAAQAGAAAAAAFGGNFATNIDQANEGVVAVQRNIGTMGQLGQEQFTKMTTGALTLANTFGQDLNGTTAAVGQLLKTGLAKDGQQALDILTRGFQSGTDKAGDLLDTVTEYSTQFRQLGLDGPTALGLLSQGLKAGARDADTVADALKEFAIRGQEAVVTTAAQQAQAAATAKAAGEALVTAQRNEVTAQRDVNQARADAAKNLVDLAQNLKSAQMAEQAAGMAVTKARQTLAQAKTAEQEMAAAQADSRRAQESLTQARQDAANKLRDLSSGLANAQLSERDAALAVKKAKDDLFNASYDADADPEQLQLAYDKAVQSLTDAKNRTADLRNEKAAADKAGVNGSQQVLSAQQAVNDAKAKEKQTAATAGSGRAEAELALQQALSGLEDQRRAVAELRAEKATADRAGVNGNEQVIAAQQAALDAQKALSKATEDDAKARAGTGPQLTGIGQAYGKLGMDAVASQKAIAAGGAPARQVLQDVITRLSGVKDPAERSALAVTLFGTKAEDLQKSLFALNPDTAVDALGQTAGAAAQTAAALDTPKSQITSMKNQMDLWLASLVDAPGPIGGVTAGLIAFSPQIGGASMALWSMSSMLSGPAKAGFDLLQAGLSGTSLKAAGAAIKMGVLSSAQGVATAAQWAWNAATSVNPLALIIIGIAALVAGLIWAYNNVGWFRDGVNGMFKGIGDAIGWVWGGVEKGFRFMARGIALVWNSTIGQMSFDVPTWVPLIGGNHIQGPKLPVPALATGGVVTSPTLALIGEAGTEAVVPLNRASEFGFGSGDGGHGTTVVLQIGAGVIIGTASEVAQKLQALITQEVRRGTIPAPAGWGT